MSRLCFGTYAKVLQDVVQEPNDNQSIAGMLFGLLAENEYVLPKVVSRLFNFKQEVPKALVAEASSTRVVQGAYKYFNEKIVSFLNPHNKDDLLPLMTQLIKDDASITEEKKAALLDKASVSPLNVFLADTFLYAIHRLNKAPIETDTETGRYLNHVLDNIARLQDVLASLPRPANLAVPAEVEADEIIYVTELLAAYANAEKLPDMSKESLDQHPRYKNDFGRRRKDYYAAETIRRASRDIFGDKDPDQFIILKDETYNGVIDVHSQDFPHGVARLNAVMTQAATIRTDKCLLSRMPDWIGASEKKGVCHILVNDRIIKGWVNNE